MDEDDITVTSPTSIPNSSPSSDNSNPHSEEVNGEQGQEQQPEEPDKPTRSVRLAHQYAPPAANNEELEDDLSDFGFDQQQVKDLMSKRELYFDATMQRPHLQTREEREHERKRLLNPRANGARRAGNPVGKPTGMTTREGQMPAKKRKVRREGLVIGGSGNWILFDPRSHDLPMVNGKDSPTIFQKFMRFEPGNARIVEINRISGGARLKSTPEFLHGKTVTYTTDGPKISEAKAVAAADATSEPPKAPPAPKRGTSGRPRGRGGRGGRGGGVNRIRSSRTANPNEDQDERVKRVKGRLRADRKSDSTVANRVSDSAKAISTITVKPVTRPTKKPAPMIKMEEERDTGSESDLTDLEESIEVGVDIGNSQGRMVKRVESEYKTGRPLEYCVMSLPLRRM